MRITKTPLIPLLAVLALAGAACSSASVAGTSASGATASSPATSSAPGMGGGDASFAYGEPGDPAAVDRVIAITQSDTMRFDPPSVAVREGETVRFDVTNSGASPHEFVLGDAAFQDEHEREMAGMGGAAMPVDEPNAIAVAPGQTKSLLWTFSAAGTLVYGCHVPGHYPAGMHGEVDVTA